MTEIKFPDDLPRPSDPALVWALAEQEWAWRYPPLKVSVVLEGGVRVEGSAEDLLTLARHRELTKAIRRAVR